MYRSVSAAERSTGTASAASAWWISSTASGVTTLNKLLATYAPNAGAQTLRTNRLTAYIRALRNNDRGMVELREVGSGPARARHSAEHSRGS